MKTAVTPSQAMPADLPWCIRLRSELDTADARAVALVSGLTVVQLNWRPRSDAWSVAQCLEHLCLSNEVYAEAIVESLGGRPSGPVEEIRPGWFGRWFIRRYIEPTTQKSPGRAPRKAVPTASRLDPSILDRFIASNRLMRDIMARARDFDVNRVRFRNPFVPVIRFTVGTGLQIVARHNHRHLLQAERITALWDFPRT